jgi:hypothetical protein
MPFYQATKFDLARYECTQITEEQEGSFLISIFRRDAAKQKEIERQFEKSVVRVRSRS